MTDFFLHLICTLIMLVSLFWIHKTTPPSVSITFLHIWQLILFLTTTYCCTNFLEDYVCQSHSIFIPLENDLVFPLTSFTICCAVPVWLMWRQTQKEACFLSLSCCKAMVIYRFLRAYFQTLAPDGYQVYVVMLCWFEGLGIFLSDVVFALEMKSHKSYLSNLSVLLFSSASVNIIIFLSNYNTAGTARTKTVSAFSLQTSNLKGLE